MNSNITPSADGMGYLIVRVFTAGGAIPLSGATVLVKSNEENGNRGDLIATLLTDRNGNTERIALPAPSRELSLSSGNIRPYATYNVEAYLDRYQQKDFYALPVFDGITSIQTVELIPLPENGRENNNDPYNVSIYETNIPRK